MLGVVMACICATLKPLGAAANAVAMLAHMVWLCPALKLGALGAPVVLYSGTTGALGAAGAAGAAGVVVALGVALLAFAIIKIPLVKSC